MPLPRRKKNASFVLVLVLGMLVLITILIIGFLGHVTAASKSVTSYRDQTGTLLLGDVAINIVKTQIDSAILTTANNAAIWASQPGAIRTAASAGGSQTTYKLYSSPILTSTASGAALGTALVADLPTTADSADWSGSDLWTDLNAPAKKSDGTYAYPIIDVVNDATDLPAGSTTTPPYTSGSFNINSGNAIGATRGTSTTSPNSPLPMPVQWLYVLKQGQVIAPDVGSSATVATFASASTAPTTANPIVGRVAFWTDDDTCRVNINTASVNTNTPTAGASTGTGTFWDTPRFTSSDDVAMATNQPVHNEFQRYPGHAATTTLSLALPELAATPEKIVGLTPRYVPGGSTEGTVPSSYTSSALGTKSNRLYASVNELLFDPPTFASGTRTPSSPLLTKTQVETAKFFLTAHSRAPELNLSGEPRVAIWPISSMANSATVSSQTPTDQLIAFCATTPGATPSPYYFTRAPHYTPTASGYPAVGRNPGSTIHTTLNYGAYVAGLPGSNSATNDVGLTRNTQLLGYLDSLTSTTPPGNISGGTATFASKYGTLGMRQILTEIFDYIRITNARDPQLDPASGLSIPPANSVAANVPYAAPAVQYQAGQQGDGQIVPTYYGTWGTYGYGRFNGAVVEVSLVFVGVGKGVASSVPAPATPITNAASQNCWPVQVPQLATLNAAATAPTATYPGALPYSSILPTPAGKAPVGGVPPQGQTAVQAMFVFNTFTPALGFGQDVSDTTVTISGLQTLTLGNSPLGFPSTATASMGSSQNNASALGSTMSYGEMVGSRVFTNIGTGVPPPIYPFFSGITNYPTGGTVALGGGGPITIQVFPLTGASTTPVYSYSIDLSKLNGNIPVPGYSTRPVFGSVRAINLLSTFTNAAPFLSDRFDSWHLPTGSNDANGEFVGDFIDTFNDTVTSMVPTTAYGDYRMLAADSSAVSGNTITGAFTSHPSVSSLSTVNHLAYGLEGTLGGRGRNSLQGSLVSGAAYFPGTTNGSPAVNPGPYGSIPMVPATIVPPIYSANINFGAPPDFDNGFGAVPDGPYINKPDEGAVYIGGAQPYRAYFDLNTPGNQAAYSSFASPERQVPSPVMFGSLPTGAPVGSNPPKPWQTLLFQPGAAGHAGLAAPKDEYLLDLFWMPQAEPYAISEPFSTAGKVNLNYQIFPFTYIDRSTAIQSVLSSEKVAVVPASKAGVYKNSSDTTFKNLEADNVTAYPAALRTTLNLSEKDGSLSQFVQRFNNYDFFKTAAEICDVYLVPSTASWTPSGGPPLYKDTAAQNAWYSSAYALVGDNTREKPYADIYSRITTKSNSFTVYYRVQTLKNPPTSVPTTWTEGQGAILGDYRGSTTLERYIDPNDTSIPDYATAAAGTANLETHYKWRVVENTRFAP